MKAQEFLREASQDTGWRYTKTAKMHNLEPKNLEKGVKVSCMKTIL